jgi:hypothetical protein
MTCINGGRVWFSSSFGVVTGECGYGLCRVFLASEGREGDDTAAAKEGRKTFFPCLCTSGKKMIYSVVPKRHYFVSFFFNST